MTSDNPAQMNISPFKQVSAWLPVAISVLAFAVALTHVVLFGAVREPDEGAAAHIWQLLMFSQLPLIAYFSLRWLPRAPAQASGILAVQLLAALVAAAPVFLFGL
jgi:hypothetical protein